jgi:hypothetical protein
MTDLVMNYTVNPIWAGLKAFGKKWIAAQEAHGRARAAHYLASMGYYKEAKELMLDSDKYKESK